MAQSKKMNEVVYAQILKELNAMGELIRAKQDEKQSVMDDFDEERKRYLYGKISQKALESSVKKTNKELVRLDKDIKATIARVLKIATQVKKFAEKQTPKTFRATMTGVKSAGQTKKKVAKKKTTKKTKKPAKKTKVKVPKAILKKELALDRKYSKRKK